MPALLPPEYTNKWACLSPSVASSFSETPLAENVDEEDEDEEDEEEELDCISILRRSTTSPEFVF